MRFLKIASFLAGSVAVLLTAAPALAQSHGIAAVVNDDIVTKYDLQQRAMFMMATQGIEPSPEAQQRILAQALRNLVDEKLQMQESKKFNQTISEQAVSSGVARLIERNGISVNEFAQRLASAGISIRTLEDQVRAEIAWQRIIGGLYGSRIRISDAQIDETLNRLTANAGKPSYRVAEIYIEATPDIGGMQGAMQGAQAMIAQVKEGAPFPVLAQQFSSAPSAASGGDVGWVREGELRSELDASLKTLEKGSLSKPITVPGGVYVLAVRDKQTSTTETYYTLKNIMASISDAAEMDAAKEKVTAGKALVKSCDTMSKDIADLEGLQANDMGELKSADLTEAILDLVGGTNVGAMSDLYETPGGVVSVMVCKRDVRGSNVPNRDQVENRLLNQQEAQASRRHLRNLHRNALIVTR